MNTQEKAFVYLKQEWKKNIGMIEVIRRGSAKILKANEDGVLLYEKESGTYMISTNHVEKGVQWLDEIPFEADLFCVSSRELADEIIKRFSVDTKLECTQMVYTSKEPIKRKEDGLIIREAVLDDLEEIHKIYQMISKGELEKIICDRNLYIGMENGKMAGFIGSHIEGSMGLLEILPAYRKKGYGTALEIFMIDQYLKKDLVPFCQVVTGNEKSFGLQQKLGLEKAEKFIYWVY